MKKIVLALFIFGIVAVTTAGAQGATKLDTSTVVGKLFVPWEMIWGPDDHIWFTQRDGKVCRLNPVTKTYKVILQITDVVQNSESGLLGMALHPNFKDSAYVYLVYNYTSGGIKERLVRYTYSSSPDTLKNRLVLLNNISGSSNHNGSRLIITPDRKILMTTGDSENPAFSQNNSNVSGKLLRLNLDGSVPSDNPKSGNLLWSKGHRNAQGLVLASNGILYSSEHGPNNDDELNIIKKGRNYGWPTVHGFCNTSTEIQFCNDSNVVPPIYAWTPTLAVAGIDYYNSTAIPEWKNCILMASLKESDFRVLQLNAAGDSITKSTTYLNNWFGRLRDICVAPNGDVYISTSNRDGRGKLPFPKPIDDRIIKISPVSTTGMLPLNNEGATVKIHPNPFKDQTNIMVSSESAGLNKEFDFKICNLLGEEVKQFKVKNKQVITLYKDDLAKGVYLYQVFIKDKLLNSGKLIIN